jgi:hypothetical protein
MTLTEIIPSLKKLSRQEKIKAIQFLASDLAEEEIEQIEADKSYEIWSPYNAFSAEKTLTEMLQNHSQQLEK